MHNPERSDSSDVQVLYPAPDVDGHFDVRIDSFSGDKAVIENACKIVHNSLVKMAYRKGIPSIKPTDDSAEFSLNGSEQGLRTFIQDILRQLGTAANDLHMSYRRAERQPKTVNRTVA